MLRRLFLSILLATAPFLIGLLGANLRQAASEEMLATPAALAVVETGFRDHHGGPGRRPPPPWGVPGGPDADEPPPHRIMCESGPALLAGYLAFLEAKLSPTDQQKDAWATFATSVRASVLPVFDLCKTADVPPDGDDPVAILGAREQPIAAFARAMGGVRAAAEAFVPKLTSEQRIAFAHALPPFPPPPPPPPGRAPL